LLTLLAARAWRVGSRGALFAAAVVAFWPFLIWETKVTVPRVETGPGLHESVKTGPGSIRVGTGPGLDLTIAERKTE
jgi:hypothetical protein